PLLHCLRPPPPRPPLPTRRSSDLNEFFFRSLDDELDQAAAYPFMTPIFGNGVVFDAPPERRAEMLHNTALRGDHMKRHASTIEQDRKSTRLNSSHVSIS